MLFHAYIHGGRGEYFLVAKLPFDYRHEYLVISCLGSISSPFLYSFVLCPTSSLFLILPFYFVFFWPLSFLCFFLLLSLLFPSFSSISSFYVFDIFLSSSISSSTAPLSHYPSPLPFISSSSAPHLPYLSPSLYLCFPPISSLSLVLSPISSSSGVPPLYPLPFLPLSPSALLPHPPPCPTILLLPPSPQSSPDPPPLLSHLPPPNFNLT